VRTASHAIRREFTESVVPSPPRKGSQCLFLLRIPRKARLKGSKVLGFVWLLNGCRLGPLSIPLSTHTFPRSRADLLRVRKPIAVPTVPAPHNHRWTRQHRCDHLAVRPDASAKRVSRKQREVPSHTVARGARNDPIRTRRHITNPLGVVPLAQSKKENGSEGLRGYYYPDLPRFRSKTRITSAHSPGKTSPPRRQPNPREAVEHPDPRISSPLVFMFAFRLSVSHAASHPLHPPRHDAR